MADIRLPLAPLTVQLPAELIEELRALAGERNISVDELVMEACLAYAEPYTWGRCYEDGRRTNAGDESPRL